MQLTPRGLLLLLSITALFLLAAAFATLFLWLAAGWLVEEELSHGGTVVGLTAEGRRALVNDGVMEGWKW